MFGVFALLGAAIAGKMYVEDDNSVFGITGGILTTIGILYWINPLIVDGLIIFTAIVLFFFIPYGIYRWFKSVPVSPPKEDWKIKYGLDKDHLLDGEEKAEIEAKQNPVVYGIDYAEQMAYERGETEEYEKLKKLRESNAEKWLEKFNKKYNKSEAVR